MSESGDLVLPAALLASTWKRPPASLPTAL